MLDELRHHLVAMLARRHHGFARKTFMGRKGREDLVRRHGGLGVLGRVETYFLAARLANPEIGFGRSSAPQECPAMATLSDLRVRREALTAQRASGVARVSYDGKTVKYRSLAEIDRAIEALEREIATAEGRRIVRHLRVTTSKNL